MNILLFAPALFLAYIFTQGISGTIKQISICASIQVLLAIPFLYENPINYIKGSFDLGRVFLHKWTVNMRFVPEWIFVHRGFHLSLLLLHILILILAVWFGWCQFLKCYAILKKSKTNTQETIQLLLLPLFMSNFIGITFARSLHYQVSTEI